jgi:hypothetical protein
VTPRLSTGRPSARSDFLSEETSSAFQHLVEDVRRQGADRSQWLQVSQREREHLVGLNDAVKLPRSRLCDIGLMVTARLLALEDLLV